MNFLIALLLSATVSEAALLSPRAATEQAGSGAPMRLVVVKSTNYVSRIKLAWDATQAPDTFILSYGIAPGVWTNSIPTGATNSYTFVKTNWSERNVRHFFVVQARIGSQISPASNEVHYPPYPDNTLLVQWQTNWPVVTVLTSTNILIPLAQWQTAGQVTDGRCFTTNLLDGAHFFAIDRPDVLTVRTFNPMNLAMGQTLCQTNFVAPATVATLSLSNPDGFLQWTVSGPNPDLWSIQFSSDGGQSWNEIDAVDGGDRSYLASLDSGQYSLVPLVQGQPGIRSNVVTVP